MDFRAITQGIENHAGLDAGVFLLNVELENLIHVLREIQNDCDVARLSGEACTRTSRKNRSTEFSACGDCRDNIIGIARNNEADGYLPVVGRVGGVKRATAAVEAHLATHAAL